MDENDRNNLKFIMNASPETLADWWDKIDVDDQVYAMELLELAREELMDRAMQLSSLESAKALDKLLNKLN